MLTDEQAKQIKEQISQQIDSSFPEEKKSQAKAQLAAMDSEQLEQFLEQNKMVSRSSGNAQGGGGQGQEGGALGNTQQCIFCSIISGDINSYKVAENSDAIAILEINPISEGHTIILPKNHSDKIPATAKKLAEKVSKLLKEKFRPKEILTANSTLFGHSVINLVPVYKNETLESERHSAPQDELENTLKKILKKEEKPIKKRAPKKLKEKLWLPRRIP